MIKKNYTDIKQMTSKGESGWFQGCGSAFIFWGSRTSQWCRSVWIIIQIRIRSQGKDSYFNFPPPLPSHSRPPTTLPLRPRRRPHPPPIPSLRPRCRHPPPNTPPLLCPRRHPPQSSSTNCRPPPPRHPRVPFMSWIRIHISPYGSRYDFSYTNPDPQIQIRIRITGSSLTTHEEFTKVLNF